MFHKHMVSMSELDPLVEEVGVLYFGKDGGRLLALDRRIYWDSCYSGLEVMPSFTVSQLYNLDARADETVYD
jgi:hypothetical protein